MIGVFVPDLEALLSEAQTSSDLLQPLFARAAARSLDRAASAAELLTAEPLAAGATGRLAAAAGDAEDAVWMRVDPIRLVPDLNAVWVQPGVRLETDHPALPELTELFAEADLVFDRTGPERDFLRLPSLPDCRFQPPQVLAGQSLDHALPVGPDARFWQRLLNDVQIILHQYRDRSEVGGLWFWGPGILPPRSALQPRYSRVYSADPELRALAEWLGLGHEALDGAGLNARRIADGSLVCWTADPGASADDNLKALFAWLRPLWRRVVSRRIDALELAGSARVWRLSTAQAWQFWRRRVESAA
ncbi:MAG: hypothetical protein ACXIUM_01095 [Wenzhouxiangella sp.]